MFESWSVGVILLSLVMLFTSWEASWMLTTAWNCKFSSYYFCLLYSQSTLFILRRSTRWMTLKGACFLSPCLRSSCNKRRTFWEDPMDGVFRTVILLVEEWRGHSDWGVNTDITWTSCRCHVTRVLWVELKCWQYHNTIWIKKNETEIESLMG